MCYNSPMVLPVPRSFWSGLAASAAAGSLLALSFPNGWMPRLEQAPGWLAWLALVPFLLAWRAANWPRSFGFGWMFGFVYFLVVLSWLRLINKDTNVDNAIGWVIYSFLGGVYFGLFSFTARVVCDRLRWPSVLVLPLAWTAWEYVRGHFITGGWPWASLGHTQYANAVVRQVAAVAGVGGVSYWIMTAGAVLAAAWSRDWHAPLRFDLRAAARRPVRLAVVLLLAAGWLYLLGRCAAEARAFARQTGSPLRLALVQGNLNTDQRWDETYKRKAFERMEPLHQQAAAGNPDLILWAESCFPGILEYEPESAWEERLRILIRTSGVPTLLTSNEYQPTYLLEGARYHHYNSAFLLGSQGETLGRYRKIKLVPGGEYIPWEWMKRFMQSVVREPIPVDFEPGTDYTPLALNGRLFAPLICYEDHFEELGFMLAKNGARFFASVSNDGWAGQSAMSSQHTAMAVFLAIEHRAYMPKASMTGPTLVIDPWGALSEALPYFEPGVKFATIHPSDFKTFFTCHGNVVPYLMLLMFATMLAACLLPKHLLVKI